MKEDEVASSPEKDKAVERAEEERTSAGIAGAVSRRKALAESRAQRGGRGILRAESMAGEVRHNQSGKGPPCRASTVQQGALL